MGGSCGVGAGYVCGSVFVGLWARGIVVPVLGFFISLVES